MAKYCEVVCVKVVYDTTTKKVELRCEGDTREPFRDADCESETGTETVDMEQIVADIVARSKSTTA